MAPEYLNKKGVTLIIVVFAMMVLGVLGWTLARMQSADFESNLRTFEPDNALNLAEAGAQWALNRLSTDSTCRSQSGLLRCPPLASPTIDTDCGDSGDWLSNPHSLSPGQYNVCVRDSCTSCSPAESGNVVIVSRGYIPSQSGSRVMRQVKLEVDIGSLTNAVETRVSDPDDNSIGLFDWSKANNSPPAVPLHNPARIEGTISAGHYEGDADGLYDELPPGNPGYDYDPPPAPILPDDNNNPENDIRDFSASFPSIDMAYFFGLAPSSRRWPSDNRPISADGALVDIEPGGGRIRVDDIGGNDFFRTGDEDIVVIRRNDITDWQDRASWTVITNVNTAGPRSRADVSPSVAWPPNTPIKLARYFDDVPPSSGVWYIGKSTAGLGETADIIIDTDNNNIDFDNTYMIAEGSIVIKGDRRLRMRFTGAWASRYPNLATQNGDIISRDRPGNAGDNEDTLRSRRRFEGLIYSQNGKVDFNYLDGTMVYGEQVFLDGTARIRYQSGNISSSGFVFEPATLRWKEE